MESSITRLLTPFCILLLPALLSAEELRWKFGPGEQWSVTLQAETSSTSTLNTKTLRTKLETRVETLWTIDEVDNGSAAITQEIVRLTLTGTGADGVGIQYDSSAEEKPVGPAKDIAKAVSPFVGAKISCRMNARGEISDVVPAEELKAALGGEKENASADRWGLELLQQSLCLLPAKEVSAGGQWEQERKLNLPLGSFVQKQTFQLPNEDGPQKEEGDHVRITTQAVLTPEKTDTSTKAGLKEQEQSGVIIFDAAAGHLVRSQTTQKLTLATPFRDKEVIVKTQSIRRVELTQTKAAATGG
jgi:hypothetical protein